MGSEEGIMAQRAAILGDPTFQFLVSKGVFGVNLIAEGGAGNPGEWFWRVGRAQDLAITWYNANPGEITGKETQGLLSTSRLPAPPTSEKKNKNFFHQIENTVKIITAPIVAPTLASVSLVSKSTAEKIGDNLGYSEKELQALNIGAKIAVGVVGGALITPAIAAIGAEPIKEAADKAKAEAEKIKAAEAAAKAKLAEVKAGVPLPLVEAITNFRSINPPLKNVEPEQPANYVELIPTATLAGNSAAIDWLEQIFKTLSEFLKGL